MYISFSSDLHLSDQIEAPFSIPRYRSAVMFDGFQEFLSWAMPRLLGGYTPGCCYISSLAYTDINSNPLAIGWNSGVPASYVSSVCHLQTSSVSSVCHLQPWPVILFIRNKFSQKNNILFTVKIKKFRIYRHLENMYLKKRIVFKI